MRPYRRRKSPVLRLRVASSISVAKPGDFGAFITAAEWLDVNYGSLLRKMLADGLGGSAVHIIKPTAQPFDPMDHESGLFAPRRWDR